MNRFGRNFSLSIFGESHGEAIGVTLDGVRPGLDLSADDFTKDILRRKSGSAGTTPRVEADQPQIVSGLFNGKTTGAPLTILFRNENVRSGDYSQFKAQPRPGHADYTARIKWHDFNDPRGGGHFSGRITLPIVAAGVVAKKMLNAHIHAEIIELGGIPYTGKEQSWKEKLDETIREKDSIGGIVECHAEGLEPGLGEPFFDSVESLIAHAVFSIPGVRGIEFGDGFQASRMKGSEHNDPLGREEDGRIRPEKNGAGGVNGGITNGNPLVFRVAFKPTSSIGKTQETLNVETGQKEKFTIEGRHDVCFVLRTPVIVEAMTAIVLADLARIL